MDDAPVRIKTTLLKDFIDRYYPTVFMAAARLTGLNDKEELATLTENVLLSLWTNRQEFSTEDRPGIYLYRILLQETVSFLRQTGNEERIRILKDILLIDPALYLTSVPPDHPAP